MSFKFKFMSSFSVTYRMFVAVALILVFFVEVFADVCVWRDPERTMIRLFPKARDYETIDKKILTEQRARIEQQIGKPLDPGEREGWIYYTIRGENGEPLGYILTDAEKGEYGVIEMVMGITTDGKIIGLYIQRARERDKEFKSKEFLDQFVGKTKEVPFQIGKEIKGKNSVPTEQVVFGVRKMLMMFDELH